MSRIPADNSEDFTSWFMPEVKDGQIIHTEKLQQRGPRGELVNLDKDEVIYSSITAGQLEEISNQAYEELRDQAYQDGLKQGYEDGLEAASQQIQQQAKSLQSTIEQFHQYLAGQDDEVEQALINIVTSVSKAVIRRELVIDSSQIHEVIKDALAALPTDPENITIILSEQDYELLNSQKDLPSDWKLQCDKALTPGGCRVTTRHSTVDFTLEEQFQQTINSLIEERFLELAIQAKERSEQKSSSVNKIASENTLANNNIDSNDDGLTGDD